MSSAESEGTASFTKTVFPGQQESERILYVIEPHFFRTVSTFLKTILIVLVSSALFLLAPDKILMMSAEKRLAGVILSAIAGILYFAGVSKSSRLTRTYITDRRIVRFERSFPFGRNRRGLFWGEVSKAKAYAPNFLFRMSNVGTLELRAKVSADEGIKIPFTWYYDDLAGYIDKILHTLSTNPEGIKTMRNFIPKPKGKRYPLDQH